MNASAMRDAGGRSVATNFLRAVTRVGRQHQFDAIVPRGSGYADLARDNVTVHELSSSLSRGSLRVFVDRVVLPRAIRRFRADVVFSMGNFAFNSGSVPQLLLLHWPYALYPESEAWGRMRWLQKMERLARLEYLKACLQSASAVAVQTVTAASRARSVLGVSEVHVLPNAVSLPPATGGEVGNARRLRGVLPEHTKWLLCLSRYYPHKNIEVLVEVAREFKRRGVSLGVVTTLDPSHDRAVRGLLSRVDRLGLAGQFVNLGPVPMADVPALYGMVSGLLLPTLLESFSGTYVEAMHFGVPVFTSDRDFARDVCGDVAWYFDPLDARSISEVVYSALFDSSTELQRRLDAGRVRSSAFNTWDEVATSAVALLEKLASR